MKAMVSRNKLSKKARRELALEKRAVWAFSPVTRVQESGKRYCRNRAKQIRTDE